MNENKMNNSFGGGGGDGREGGRFRTHLLDHVIEGDVHLGWNVHGAHVELETLAFESHLREFFLLFHWTGVKIINCRIKRCRSKIRNQCGNAEGRRS